MFRSDLNPFLKIAVTSAVFQSSGILPDSRDLLNKRHREVDSSVLNSFSTHGGTISGPCALVGFNSLSFFSVAFGVTLKFVNDTPSDFEQLFKFRKSSTSSLVNTMAKTLFRVSAFCESVTASSPFSCFSVVIPAFIFVFSCTYLMRFCQSFQTN